ncbi:hypothetical protein KEM54_000800, partial [Ascosphaera aggregata]
MDYRYNDAMTSGENMARTGYSRAFSGTGIAARTKNMASTCKDSFLLPTSFNVYKEIELPDFAAASASVTATASEGFLSTPEYGFTTMAQEDMNVFAVTLPGNENRTSPAQVGWNNPQVSKRYTPPNHETNAIAVQAMLQQSQIRKSQSLREDVERQRQDHYHHHHHRHHQKQQQLHSHQDEEEEEEEEEEEDEDDEEEEEEEDERKSDQDSNILGEYETFASLEPPMTYNRNKRRLFIAISHRNELSVNAPRNMLGVNAYRWSFLYASKDFTDCSKIYAPSPYTNGSEPSPTEAISLTHEPIRPEEIVAESLDGLPKDENFLGLVLLSKVSADVPLARIIDELLRVRLTTTAPTSGRVVPHTPATWLWAAVKRLRRMSRSLVPNTVEDLESRSLRFADKRMRAIIGGEKRKRKR